MSISDRLAALGVESEAVKAWWEYRNADADEFEDCCSCSLVTAHGHAYAAIESLLDEVERLRCCGNCGEWKLAYPRGRCCCADEYQAQTWGHDPCHFTPSRWKED